jgi:glycosyltransferase involved in cell wall biosynthesis
MKIVITSNTCWYIYNFRARLIQYLIQNGWIVHIIAPIDKYASNLEQMGAIYHNIKLSRFKKSILSDFFYIIRLFFIFIKVQPAVIHNFTIKPVIYGSIASKFFKKTKIVNSIPGLGISFNSNNEKKVISSFILFLYRIAIKKKHKMIFQNPDDMDFFIKNKISSQSNSYLIKGSGVDLAKFSKLSDNSNLDKIRFGMMCRMLESKGAKDFIEASKIVFKKNPNTKFYLLGSPDSNSPDSISIDWLNSLNNLEHVQWRPHSDDVVDFLYNIDVFVLPTYYPEGLPKSLLEAAAMSLPLISTKVPGCKEIVRNNFNGLLVNPRDRLSLADKMYDLSVDSNKRVKMGRNSRILVENEYCDKSINDRTFKLYLK